MYQGTTPTIPITIKGVDLTLAKLFLTLEDDMKTQKITFESGEDFTVTFDGTNTVGTVRLTQEQTLAMSVGNGYAQIRYIFQDGTADATNKAKFHIDPVLLKGVIEYG